MVRSAVRLLGSQYGPVVMLAPPTSVNPGLNPGLVRGLRFVKVNLTLRDIFWVLQFSSLSKIDFQLISSGCDAVLVGHAWIVLWGQVPSLH